MAGVRIDSMRLTPTLLLLLLSVGSFAPTAAHAADPRTSRTRVSKSGLYAVRLVEAGDKSCNLEVLRDGGPHWSLRQCVGTVDDAYFVSDDGEKVWVLYTLPFKATKRPRKAKGAAWTFTVVAREYDRAGTVVKEKQLRDFVRSKAGLEDVRQLEKRLKWLEGVVGERGNPPRLNEAGQVELNTLEHRLFKLDF